MDERPSRDEPDPGRPVEELVAEVRMLRDELSRRAEGPGAGRGDSTDASGSAPAREALDEREEHFRALADALPLLIWTARPDGFTDYVNARWYEYSGQTPGEALGWNWTATLHPDDSRGALERWERAVLTGKLYDSEYRIRRADGSFRWFLSRGVAIRDDRARIIRWVGTCTDIDDRRRAEDALRASEAHFRLAMMNPAVVVWHQDRDLRYTWVENPPPERSAEMLQGLCDDDLFPADEAGRLTEIKRRVLETGVGERSEILVSLDGRYRCFDTIVEPWRDAEGRINGIAGAAFDVSERRQAERALRASDRQFRAVFEGALDAMVIADDAGRYTDANPAACSLFGLPAAEMMGRSIVEFATAGFDFDASWRDFRSRGSAQGEFLLVRADGSARDVEFAAKADILPGRHLSVLRDVTGRKAAEGALRRYAARLEHLRAIDGAILEARSPEEIAGAALGQLACFVPCRWGNVTLFDIDNAEVRVFAAYDSSAAGPPARAALPPGAPGDDEREQLRRGANCSVADLLEAAPASPVTDALMDCGVRSYLRVPLLHRGGLIGALSLFSDGPASYTAEHLEVAREVADPMAIAIRQSLLFEEVRAGRARLETLSRRLIRAEEDERRRIAHELHDETGQTLTAIKINLQAALRALDAPGTARRLEDSLGLIERTIAQMRGLSLDLRPSLLDDLGLVPALRSLGAGHGERLGIAVEFRADPAIDRCDPEVETACYRVAQEAMTNVAKHARAGRVRVELAWSGSELRLVVADDGVGFDVLAATARAAAGSSLGMLGMRERAALVGGRLDIESVPGRGTELRATFPIAEN